MAAGITIVQNEARSIAISYNIENQGIMDGHYCHYFLDIAKNRKMHFECGEDDFGTRFFYLSSSDPQAINEVYKELKKS